MICLMVEWSATVTGFILGVIYGLRTLPRRTDALQKLARTTLARNNNVEGEDEGKRHTGKCLAGICPVRICPAGMCSRFDIHWPSCVLNV